MLQSAPPSVQLPPADKRRQGRRNLRTAAWLTLLALGFYAAFFWSMSRPH